MKTDISIRLAVAAVTSVFLFTSCPNPVTTPAKPPAPNYKVQYNYLNPDGSESSTPTNIRVYNTTKDGASQPGHAVARLEQPGIYSILFSDDIGNDDADYIQLFFVSDASMPFRIVNRFTMTDDSGQEVQETVVGIPSRYDTSTQSFDITFSSVQNPSDTLTLQDVVLNKEIFRIKPDGPLGEIEIPIIGGGTMKQYTYPRAHSWLYMDYLLLAGTSVAYAIQHRLQAGESAWSESTYGEGFVAPPSQSGHLTPVFGWNSFWRGVLKVVCTVVAVVAFVVAVVATPAAVVTASAALGAIAITSNVVGAATLVGLSHLEASEKYDPEKMKEGPIIFIWEVDEKGEPQDAPESKLANDGLVHLHNADNEKKELILKVQTISGTWPNVGLVRNDMVKTLLKHKIEVATDINFSTSTLLDKKSNIIPFSEVFYLRITQWEERKVDPTELSSHIYLHFLGLDQDVCANINGEPAIIETRLEDATENLEPTDRIYGNIFKVNICELNSLHTDA